MSATILVGVFAPVATISALAGGMAALAKRRALPPAINGLLITLLPCAGAMAFAASYLLMVREVSQ